MYSEEEAVLFGSVWVNDNYHGWDSMLKEVT